MGQSRRQDLDAQNRRPDRKRFHSRGENRQSGLAVCRRGPRSASSIARSLKLTAPLFPGINEISAVIEGPNELESSKIPLLFRGCCKTSKSIVVAVLKV